ncbi:2-octaprenyl-6-methoxyphenol hydroxylase [Alteromonas sp. KUL42]|uniref:FAD-dependent monooxygenase n=1 Tax=Alteromonas sp. KUL42 TaxID=2480797 RepID=UPI0010359BD1|nr:FAD-dependent monooxygenase [Alteromonas sp. KUL42]TAP38241.1 FAD-dependent 2-octaprenylphenol hydroxylase [Alteromonas sp. KUL42]GEA05472.1 2-octaprenyl-6-methoxyphenol hydroxylase [Alteromonas sp. KUL42]
MQHVDIAIVGGSIVGLTLAAALKAVDVTVAVIDKNPSFQALAPKPTARVSAINHGNIRALEAFDVWSGVQADRASPYTSMHVWDKDSFGDINFSCDDIGSDALGVIVENQALVNALAQATSQQNNVLQITAGIERILAGPLQTMLMLDNGDALSCRLLVGADGANSLVRRESGLPITFKDYEHTAIVANIKTREPHNGVARQAFTPTGPLALLPMASGDVCSIVWSQHTQKATELMTLDDDAFCHALTAACNSVLGPITLETERAAFPLTMRYARQWAKEGVVLVGDAAHTIHPLAGQGANLGMQDALALAALLQELVLAGKDIGLLKNLRSYERSRKTEAMKMIAAMDGFKFLFDGDDPIKKLVRGIGLSTTDKLGAIKNAFVSHAMGL